MDWRCCLSFLLVLLIHFSGSVASDSNSEETDQAVNWEDYEDYTVDQDLQTELQKRKSGYQFGLGKRAKVNYGFGLGKRSPYNFGLGKRDSSWRGYGFGLGKRASQFSFGLGKRGDESDSDFIKRKLALDKLTLQPVELGSDIEKRAKTYAFGLGKRDYESDSDFAKRAKTYAFGLGKREPKLIGFGLGKRPAYGFGLGKRSVPDTTVTENPEIVPESSEEIDVNRPDKRAKCTFDCRVTYPSYTYALKKLREQQKIRGTLGKRGRAETDSTRFLKRFPAYTFGLGKRSNQGNVTEDSTEESEEKREK